jgi:hypothetical protein
MEQTACSTQCTTPHVMRIRCVSGLERAIMQHTAHAVLILCRTQRTLPCGLQHAAGDRSTHSRWFAAACAQTCATGSISERRHLGEAPVVLEFKHLGRVLSKNFDDSVTIMARIRLARIAFFKQQEAIFGTRRVALESKKMAYEALVLSLLLNGSECWAVTAANMRLLQRSHRRGIRIMCRVTRRHTRRHRISTKVLPVEAKLGVHDIRHYAHSRALRSWGTSFVWTPTGLRLSCSAVG